MSPATAPLTARGERTRTHLLAAARQVFADQGFAATRMSDIAAAAGVSHGTVYTYFDTKEDVLAAVLDDVVADLHEALRASTATDPVARIRDANNRYLDGYAQHGRLLLVVEEAAQTDARFLGVLTELRTTHVARVAAAIRRLQADGDAATDIDPMAAAAALCAMVEGFARHWFGRGEQHDPALATDTLTLLWARALGLSPIPPPAGGIPHVHP